VQGYLNVFVQTGSDAGWRFWFRMHQFVQCASSTTDAVVRVSCINRQLCFTKNTTDDGLIESMRRYDPVRDSYGLYGDAKEGRISFSSIRRDSNVQNSILDRLFWRHLRPIRDKLNDPNTSKTMHCLHWIHLAYILMGCFVLVPVYVLSRLLNFCAPVFVLVLFPIWTEEYGRENGDIATFHRFLQILQGLCAILALLALRPVWKLQYRMFHVAPGDDWVARDLDYGNVCIAPESVETYYEIVRSAPRIKEIVAVLLGDDVASIVWLYLCPRDSEEQPTLHLKRSWSTMTGSLSV